MRRELQRPCYTTVIRKLCAQEEHVTNSQWRQWNKGEGLSVCGFLGKRSASQLSAMISDYKTMNDMSNFFPFSLVKTD